MTVITFKLVEAEKNGYVVKIWIPTPYAVSGSRIWLKTRFGVAGGWEVRRVIPRDLEKGELFDFEHKFKHAIYKEVGFDSEQPNPEEW